MEDSLAIGGNTNHFDPAAQYEEDAVMEISAFQDDFICLGIPVLAKCCQPSNLTGVKLGKSFLDLLARS